MQSEVGIKINFIPCGYPIAPSPFVKRPTFQSVLSLLMVVPLARKAYGAHPAHVTHRELH